HKATNYSATVLQSRFEVPVYVRISNDQQISNSSKRRNTMKQKLMDLLTTMQEKAYDHREVLIRVGGVLVGAAVGALVATAIANAQQDLLLEEILMAQENPPVEVSAE